MMKWLNEWHPAFLMVAINFALSIVNILHRKVIDGGMDHLPLITYRLYISVLVLAPMAYLLERSTLTSYLFFFVSLQNTMATFICAFVNMVPVITFLMVLPFGSMSGNAKVLGTVVTVCGAMVLTLYEGVPLTNFSDPGETTTPTERWTIRTIALVVGVLLWSSWFLVQAKISKIYPCQYSSTTVMYFLGAIQSTLFTLVTNHQDFSSWILKGKLQILTVLYSGIVGAGLSFVGMSYCVKKRGPVFTATFSPLIQIVVAMIGFSILDEPLHLGSICNKLLSMLLTVWV
ncbi:hypothetical protein MKX01_030587 [Papaver californicum]|nr:hypothetical protein MKX01_030587 [Papaver californicum]